MGTLHTSSLTVIKCKRTFQATKVLKPGLHHSWSICIFYEKNGGREAEGIKIQIICWNNIYAGTCYMWQLPPQSWVYGRTSVQLCLGLSHCHCSGCYQLALEVSVTAAAPPCIGEQTQQLLFLIASAQFSMGYLSYGWWQNDSRLKCTFYS